MMQSAAFGRDDARPLGALAEVLTEDYSWQVRLAVEQIAVRAGCPGQARVYDASEAGRQWLQPGGWVRLGEVVIDGVVAFVEVQVGTGAIRERRGAGSVPADATRR